MNWDDAIKAHAAWKMRLSAYIRAPDKSIDPALVGRDDRCPLGIWLHGEANRRLSGLPEYRALIAEHARFHRSVGAAVQKANAGQIVEQQEILGWDTEFAASSRNIVSIIVQLKQKVPMP